MILAAAGAAAALWLGPQTPIPVAASGGEIAPPPAASAGYSVDLHYAANDAPPGSAFSLFYVRLPTPGERLPHPTPPHDWGGPNAVFFFNFTIHASKPVHFAQGSTLDVRFPFNLDDAIPYVFSAASVSQAIDAPQTKASGDVLHVVLPAFTAEPDQEFFAEIDGLY